MTVLHLGGFSEAARALAEETKRPHTRQGVYKLWRNRASNGFPEQHVYDINGKARVYFDISEVLAWAVTLACPECQTVTKASRRLTDGQ